MTAHPSGRVVIAPSILAADFGRLREEVAAVTEAGADWLHFDIMDGHFVPNISFGPQVLAALRPHSKLPFDVHLMITPVDPFVAAYAEAGADHILIHPEAGPHPHRTLQLIRSLGKKAGVVLNPGTPIESIAWLLDLADIVLVMSVNPGFGGQQFLPSQLPKIAALRRLIDGATRLGADVRLEADMPLNTDLRPDADIRPAADARPAVDARPGASIRPGGSLRLDGDLRLNAGARTVALAVDGGITPETAAAVRAAGADTLIAGTAVFAAPDRAAAIAALRGEAVASAIADASDPLAHPPTGHVRPGGAAEGEPPTSHARPGDTG